MATLGRVNLVASVVAVSALIIATVPAFAQTLYDTGYNTGYSYGNSLGNEYGYVDGERDFFSGLSYNSNRDYIVADQSYGCDAYEYLYQQTCLLSDSFTRGFVDGFFNGYDFGYHNGYDNGWYGIG